MGSSLCKGPYEGIVVVYDVSTRPFLRDCGGSESQGLLAHREWVALGVDSFLQFGAAPFKDENGIDY